MYIYRTYFNLIAPVKDINAAQDYLLDDDMTKYLKEDSRCPGSTAEKIKSIQWILKTEDSGYVELKTYETLSERELNDISDWVCGQNSDGIGEGFEQQAFACYEDDNYDDYEDEYSDNFIMASFDWETNDCLFELYGEE